MWLSELVCCTVRQAELLIRCGSSGSPSVISVCQLLSYLGHSLAPLSQALVGRTDAQWIPVIDANGIVLAHVYGQPDGAIAVSDSRLTNDEARRISKLIARLPEL